MITVFGRFQYILFFLSVLFVACDRSGEDEVSATIPAGEVVAVLTAAATGQPEPTIAVEGLREVDSFEMTSLASVLEKLGSYRLEMELRFEGLDDHGKPLQWRLLSQMIVVEESAGRRLELTVEGLDPAPELATVMVVDIGEESYLFMPGIGCLSDGVQSAGVSGEGLADPDSFLAGLTGARLEASGEDKNGVSSRRYVLDETMLPRFFGEPVTADGRVYVAEDGGYVTQVSLSAEGQSDFLSAGYPQDGTLWLELNVFDVNQTLIVEPPPECLEAGMYPVLSDAFEFNSLGDLVNYKTHQAIEDVVAFYLAELPAAGWTALEEAVVLENSAFLSYQRDDMTLIISIDIDPVDQAVTVFISP